LVDGRAGFGGMGSACACLCVLVRACSSAVFAAPSAKCWEGDAFSAVIEPSFGYCPTCLRLLFLIPDPRVIRLPCLCCIFFKTLEAQVSALDPTYCRNLTCKFEGVEFWMRERSSCTLLTATWILPFTRNFSSREVSAMLVSAALGDCKGLTSQHSLPSSISVPVVWWPLNFTSPRLPCSYSIDLQVSRRCHNKTWRIHKRIRGRSYGCRPKSIFSEPNREKEDDACFRISLGNG